MIPRILVAEDEEIMRVTVLDHLRSQGWLADEAETGTKALEMIRAHRYELVLSDIRMPGMSGEALLTEIKRVSPRTDVILMTAYGSSDNAVNCLKKGATDYILKPFDLDDLSFRINRLLEQQWVKARCVSLEHCGGQRWPIIGSSPAIQKTLGMISQVAKADSTVLIHGESGTGKELVAAAIHYESRRSSKAYVRVNCAAIPSGLMESELFGHEKGAFTGADKAREGKFELADQGTILLDEIGDMHLDMQVKLLRVLQEREIEKVGGKHPIPIDVRVVCATAKNLADEVQKGNFRQDLFYRLQVIPMHIPPLRERDEDILELADYFLDEFGRERGVAFELSEDARQALQRYTYPGNVRELRNILERISVLAPAPKVQLWDLPVEIRESAGEEGSREESLAAAVASAERNCIQRALKKAGGNKTESAFLLGISRKNLWEKMKHYGL
ncbi:MAG: sigma-54 dependent transcriptional regulator [Desulfuromonadales bacterium]